MTAHDLLTLGVIDEVIPEPVGGAHRDAHGMAERVTKVLSAHLGQLEELPAADLLAQRYDKYRRMGAVAEASPPAS